MTKEEYPVETQITGMDDYYGNTVDISDVVPGTVHLVEYEGASGLRGSQQDIVLFPQPSADPEDPLNWAKWRKYLNIGLIYFYTFSTGVGGTSVYSVLVPISEATGITLAELNRGTGFLFLLAGWSNLIWQPMALTFGRRPIFLLSLLGCAGMSEWAARIDSYGAWAACRCLFGFMVAPVEVLPEHCIGELFFAHERGAYMGGYMLVLCGSNFIAPLIAGFMNQNIGWQWVQHWSALLLLLNFVLAFFFYEDTIYKRNTVEADVVLDVSDSGDAKAVPNQIITLSTERVYEEHYHRKTFLEKMKLWSKNTDVSFVNFVKIMYRPVVIFFTFPLIAWCGFFYGFALVWYNVYNATSSSILSGPPYNFSSSAVGLAYLAPLVGALIGGIYSGPFADWITIKLARRNKGVREPEQRLWGLLSWGILMPAGLILWGVGAYHNVHWMGLMVSSAITGYGNVIGGSFALAYALDAYKDMSGESLVSVILCRNTMSFAINYAITPWIDNQGLQNTFIVAAVLALVTGATTLLIIWKGKALRKLSAERYWKFATSQVIPH